MERAFRAAVLLALSLPLTTVHAQAQNGDGEPSRPLQPREKASQQWEPQEVQVGAGTTSDSTTSSSGPQEDEEENEGSGENGDSGDSEDRGTVPTE